MDLETNVISYPSPTTSYYSETIIGEGGYGTVYKAKDINNSSRPVALKKVRVSTHDQGIPVSFIREIALVRQLQRFKHPNIINFYDICYGHQECTASSLVLFIVFEWMEKDLRKYIDGARMDDLSSVKIKDIMFQVICGVDFLHSQRIVHRDLKPDNVLVNSDGLVKLADFGLSKVYDFSMTLTTVVVTLWYRPPEVLLGCSYASSVDMWSVGCIFAELVKRQPMFPGANEKDQLEKIFDFVGTPTSEDWPIECKILSSNFSSRKGQNIDISTFGLSFDGMDLMKKLLVFNPLSRISSHAATSHPYFEQRAVPQV